MKKTLFGERFYDREEIEEAHYELIETMYGEKIAMFAVTNVIARTILCVITVIATPITIAFRVLSTLVGAIFKSMMIVISETGNTINFITNPIAFDKSDEDEHP